MLYYISFLIAMIIFIPNFIFVFTVISVVHASTFYENIGIPRRILFVILQIILTVWTFDFYVFRRFHYNVIVTFKLVNLASRKVLCFSTNILTIALNISFYCVSHAISIPVSHTIALVVCVSYLDACVITCNQIFIFAIFIFAI